VRDTFISGEATCLSVLWATLIGGWTRYHGNLLTWVHLYVFTVIDLGLWIFLLMFTFTCTIVPCCRLTPHIYDMKESASEDWDLCVFWLICGTGDRIADLHTYPSSGIAPTMVPCCRLTHFKFEMEEGASKDWGHCIGCRSTSYCWPNDSNCICTDLVLWCYRGSGHSDEPTMTPASNRSSRWSGSVQLMEQQRIWTVGCEISFSFVISFKFISYFLMICTILPSRKILSRHIVIFR
jgi:hypothetical protein